MEDQAFALAEAAQGAAPEPICPVAKHRTDNTPNRCTLPWLHGGDHAFEDEGAAPRADELDVEAVLAAAESSHERNWNADHQGGHTKRDWRKCSEWPCSSLSPLSRPSDEVKP